MLLGNRRAMRGGSRAVELEPPDPASADIVLEDMGQSVEAMNYEGKKALCESLRCKPPQRCRMSAAERKHGSSPSLTPN